MTITVQRPVSTAASRVLDRAVDAVAARRAADLVLLEAVIEWAEAHPVPVAEAGDYARWESPSQYGEGVVPLAGAGAPLVAQFAPDGLAAGLGWSVPVAASWMGDGLELKYRLPGVLDLTRRGVLPLHLARYVAENTRDLSIEAAGYADRLLTRNHAKMTRRRIRALVEEARLYHDPDRAVDEEQQALAARHVTLWPGSTPATTDVSMKLDTRDAEAFDRAVAQTAEALKRLGDGDGLDIRRARAVGVLADPQRALDLLTPDATPAGAKPGAVKPSAVLWLHLDESAVYDLDMFAVPVTADRYGTLTSDLVKNWLAQTTVIVRPVLDLHRTDAVDSHDPPAWMADLIRLRDPCCVFPGCHRSSRACDLDHIDPYLPPDQEGPPGQTRPDKSHRCAGDTTEPRPSHAGAIDAHPTAATTGPVPPATPTTYPRHLPDPERLSVLETDRGRRWLWVTVGYRIRTIDFVASRRGDTRPMASPLNFTISVVVGSLGGFGGFGGLLAPGSRATRRACGPEDPAVLHPFTPRRRLQRTRRADHVAPPEAPQAV